LLTRTHPLVEGLSSHVMDTALDPAVKSVARPLRRYPHQGRHHPTTSSCSDSATTYSRRRAGKTEPLLAEDCCTLGFTGAPESAGWIPAAAVEQILLSKPDANVPADVGADFVRKVVDSYDHIRPHLEKVARSRGRDLLDAHMRVARPTARVCGTQEGLPVRGGAPPPSRRPWHLCVPARCVTGCFDRG